MRVNLEARAAAAEQRRAKTRERLLDAATAVIADKGPDATSVEDIVAAAGVSRGTFYNYFPTTDELIHALNDRSADAFFGPMRELVADLTNPALRLAAAAHFTLATMVADPTRAWVILRLDGSRAPRHRDASRFLYRLFEEGMASGLFEPLDLDAARSLTLGALRNAARDMLLEDAPPDLARHVIAMVLRALGMAPDEARRTSFEGHAHALRFCTRAAA
jgi:AcrR family transcriptional regulator